MYLAISIVTIICQHKAPLGLLCNEYQRFQQKLMF